jgi:hypothetical protein
MLNNDFRLNKQIHILSKLIEKRDKCTDSFIGRLELMRDIEEIASAIKIIYEFEREDIFAMAKGVNEKEEEEINSFEEFLELSGNEEECGCEEEEKPVNTGKVVGEIKIDISEYLPSAKEWYKSINPYFECKTTEEDEDNDELKSYEDFLEFLCEHNLFHESLSKTAYYSEKFFTGLYEYIEDKIDNEYEIISIDFKLKEEINQELSDLKGYDHVITILEFDYEYGEHHISHLYFDRRTKIIERVIKGLL